MRGIFVVLLCVALAAAVPCKTFEDVVAPWEVAVSAIRELEGATTTSAFANTVGGVQDRITRGAAAVLQCAEDLLPFSWATNVAVVRDDGRCPVSLLGDASLVSSFNVSLAGDACCNPALRESACCAPRPYSYTLQRVVSQVRVATKPGEVGMQCGNTALAQVLWNRYPAFSEFGLDGFCEAAFPVNVVDVQRNVAKIRECMETMYRADLVCHSNEQCASGLCWNQACVPEPAYAPQRLLTCTLDALGDAQSALMLELGLRVASLNSDLERAFVSRVATPACVSLAQPLNGFVDVRTAPVLGGVDTQQDCESAPLTADDPCEDGQTPLDGCSSRNVCAYDWSTRGDSPLVPRAFVVDDPRLCTDGGGGVCSNPAVTGARCETDAGCSVWCGPGQYCLTREQCEASGYCVGSPVARAAGDCVQAFQTVDPGAVEEDQCAPDMFWAPGGCVPFEGGPADAAACASASGTWVALLNATTRDACLARTRCNRSSGGVVAPVAQWVPGVWGKGTLTRLNWRNARRVRKRRWLWLVDWTRFSELLSVVFVRQVASTYGSYRRCQVLPLLTIARYGLCDCSRLPGRPASATCWDATAPLVLGVRRASKGTAGTLRTTVGTASWFVSSCDDDTITCVLEFGLLLRVPPTASGIATTTTTTSSGGGGGSRAPRVTISSGRNFELILDKTGAVVVGYALSDLLYLGLSERLRNGVELCIRPVAAAMPAECKNCTMGFGYSASGTTALAALKDVPLTVRDNSYCGTVSKGGYYVVALLLATAPAVRAVASWALLLLLLAWATL